MGFSLTVLMPFFREQKTEFPIRITQRNDLQFARFLRRCSTAIMSSSMSWIPGWLNEPCHQHIRPVMRSRGTLEGWSGAVTVTATQRVNRGLPFDRLQAIGAAEVDAREFTRPPGHRYHSPPRHLRSGPGDAPLSDTVTNQPASPWGEPTPHGTAKSTGGRCHLL